MKQDLEEIHIKHRINKYWGMETIPYHDMDVLERMVVLQGAQSALLIMETNLEEFKTKSQDKEKIELTEKMIESLHHLYIFSNDIWEEGKYQHEFAHKVTMENLRLKAEIETLKYGQDINKKIGEF